MQTHKFSTGDPVYWIEGGDRRKGQVTDCDVEPPSGATDKAGSVFYRITDENGGSHVVSELDLEPSHKPISPSGRD